MLPSKLLNDGDQLDLTVAEIATGYEQFVKKNPGIKTTHGYTQDQLQEMMKRVKNAPRNKRQDKQEN